MGDQVSMKWVRNSRTNPVILPGMRGGDFSFSTIKLSPGDTEVDERAIALAKKNRHINAWFSEGGFLSVVSGPQTVVEPVTSPAPEVELDAVFDGSVSPEAQAAFSDTPEIPRPSSVPPEALVGPDVRVVDARDMIKGMSDVGHLERWLGLEKRKTVRKWLATRIRKLEAG